MLCSLCYVNYGCSTARLPRNCVLCIQKVISTDSVYPGYLNINFRPGVWKARLKVFLKFPNSLSPNSDAVNEAIILSLPKRLQLSIRYSYYQLTIYRLRHNQRHRCSK
jgi:hypothetical protein